MAPADDPASYWAARSLQGLQQRLLSSWRQCFQNAAFEYFVNAWTQSLLSMKLDSRSRCSTASRASAAVIAMPVDIRLVRASAC